MDCSEEREGEEMSFEVEDEEDKAVAREGDCTRRPNWSGARFAALGCLTKGLMAGMGAV